MFEVFFSLIGCISFFDEGAKDSDVESAGVGPKTAKSDVADASAELPAGASKEKQKGVWSSVGSAAKRVGTVTKKIGSGVATGVKKVGGGVASGTRTVGGGMTGGAKKITSGVKRVSRHLVLRQRRKDADKGKSSWNLLSIGVGLIDTQVDLLSCCRRQAALL